MFERELGDLAFVQRWGIVRTVRPQSVAEHTFLVAHYVNDICVFLNVHAGVHLAALEYALWHDMDEIFTGDPPGPNKRALLGDGGAKTWKAKTREWLENTFNLFRVRSGQAGLLPQDREVVELIVKTADWLEASVKMSTETQLGNQNTARHIVPNLRGAQDTASRLCAMVGLGGTSNETALLRALEKATNDAQYALSDGPWITREDESRA